MHITFEFATKDDCLDKMVPSDLRQLVGARDRALEQVAALAAQVEYLTALVKSEAHDAYYDASDNNRSDRWSETFDPDIRKEFEKYWRTNNVDEKIQIAPQQHLAEVKAQAVRDFVHWGTVKLDPEFAEFKDCAETFISIGCPSVPREVISD